MEDLEQAFECWKDVLELQTKYVLAVGDYRKNQALGTLREAVAAGQVRRAREAESVIRQLDAAMHRVRRQQRKLTHRIALIERKAADAAMIRRGESLPANLLGSVWAGYAFFQRLCPGEVVAKVGNTALAKESRSGGNYCYNRDPARSCPNAPDQVTTVEGLIAWLQANRYMPRRGTPAYAQVTAAFSQVAAAFEQQTKRLEESLAALEKGAVEAWKPVMLATLVNDDVAKSILKTSLEDD